MRGRWIGVVLVAALACGTLVTGCAPSKEQIAAQERDQCFANQLKIKVAIDAVNADTGVYPDLTDVIGKLNAECPSGGTYSYNAETGEVPCSVHGSRPAE